MDYNCDPAHLVERIKREGLLEVTLSFDGDTIDQLEAAITEALSLARSLDAEGWRRDLENAHGDTELGNTFLLSVECERDGETIRLVGEAERDPDDAELFWWQGQRGEHHADHIVASGWTIVAWRPMPLPAPPEGGGR